jgi:hypothetical protein
MTSDIILKAGNSETLSDVFNVVSDYTGCRSRDSSVMLWAGRPGFCSQQRQRPDRLWVPPSLLSKGIGVSFPGDKTATM